MAVWHYSRKALDSTLALLHATKHSLNCAATSYSLWFALREPSASMAYLTLLVMLGFIIIINTFLVQ